jgi:hypothetical protein
LAFESCHEGREEYVPVPYNRLSRSLPLLLAFALVLGACERVREAVPGGDDGGGGPKISEANFQLGEVRAVDPLERPDSGQKAQDSAGRVLALVNRYYAVSFLDPTRWVNGQHPELNDLFTAESRPSIGPNINHLAISDLWDKIESVEPVTQRLGKVSFDVEPDGSLPIGIATVTFEGKGKAVDGDDVTIKHDAVFYLQREGEDYRISAFTTSLTAMAAQ